MSRDTRALWKNWLIRSREKTAPYWDRMMDWAAARDLQERMDYATDADWAILAQRPARPRLFVWSIAALCLLVLLWAAFAQIDEVTRGEGKVVPFSQIQHIQSLDGGVVGRIWVHEGQIVEKGQLLLSIDNTRYLSSLQASQAQYLALQGKAARLRAIANGTSLAMPVDVSKKAPDIAKQEAGLYQTK